MNFLKRAIKYCVRQRLRTLLLFLTFTLLSTTVLIAVSSEEAVLQGTKQIKETVGASVRMEIDMNNQNNFGRLRISEMGLLDIPIMATVLQKK
ncbi:hypothetical protein [Mediterraneibacter gnavus]|uniref:hypothetical protein n=1 Tax=Mediterraneibacter gnavus TaxID=33038 RepID=UPI0036F3E8E8